MRGRTRELQRDAVRQAIAYALDRRPMIEYLWRNMAQPARSVLPAQSWADNGDVPKDQTAKFKITTKRKDDSVKVQAEEDKAVFAVKSPSGSARRSSSGRRPPGRTSWCCGST